MLIADRIRERGPLTVAAFMELALYHPEFGYYARAAQRTGRAGDFFTSVDVGPIFGELLEIQLAEVWEVLGATANNATAENAENAEQDKGFAARSASSAVAFDLVEAGAGNGRLSADILRAARSAHPAFYQSLRLHLVEASAEAREAQRATLGDVAERLVSSSAELPETFEGVLLANELLDAMPVHQVVMRENGLREVYIVANHGKQPQSAQRPQSRSSSANSGGSALALRLVEGPPSTPALAGYLARLGVELEPGWRTEINLRAVDWVRDAARRLRRGFMILIDYGHDARELYSASHSAGTLTTFSRHRSAGPEAGAIEWLDDPGEQDITSHVDFTSIRAAAEAEGMQTIALLDQTYFLLGLLPAIANAIGSQQSAIRKLKTLMIPGGLGSSHKVLILGKGVGTPALKGTSFGVRVT